MSEAENNDWPKRLSHRPFYKDKFTPHHMENIKQRLSSNLRPVKRVSAWSFVFVSSCLAVVLLLALPSVFNGITGSHQTLQDRQTPVALEQMRPTGEMFLFDPMYDNMDRGRHDLMRGAVVDPAYYAQASFNRGDIVYFDGSGVSDRLGLGVSRIVGLPGEKIKVDAGRIYINDRLLDAFYGQAHVRGLDQEAFLQLPDTSNLNVESILEEVYQFSMAELTIPPDSLFVVGDDWMRSLDSLRLGPIPASLVEGKVVGICPGCSDAS